MRIDFLCLDPAGHTGSVFQSTLHDGEALTGLGHDVFAFIVPYPANEAIRYYTDDQTELATVKEWLSEHGKTRILNHVFWYQPWGRWSVQVEHAGKRAGWILDKRFVLDQQFPHVLRAALTSDLAALGIGV